MLLFAFYCLLSIFSYIISIKANKESILQKYTKTLVKSFIYIQLKTIKRERKKLKINKINSFLAKSLKNNSQIKRFNESLAK